MKCYSELDEVSRDILKEFGNIGTGNAVTSLSQMMDCTMVINTPIFKIVKYQEIYNILEKAEELQAGILVEVVGELRGVFLFLLNDTFTEAVLNTLLEPKARSLTDLDRMEKSLISEMGNIMCGSYIRALSQLLDSEMDVSIPHLCIDMGGAILSVLFSKFLQMGDDIMLIENEFQMDEGQSFLGRILFLPEICSLDKVLQKAKE
ncbi:MAG: chemotaxis protein CheC [Lachnospiraceae bacterium]|jgi:chemotaxis protein CheC|nr:chemotaxis protein CheC [Lachnospiraceae bacterium]